MPKLAAAGPLPTGLAGVPRGCSSDPHTGAALSSGDRQQREWTHFKAATAAVGGRAWGKQEMGPVPSIVWVTCHVIRNQQEVLS